MMGDVTNLGHQQVPNQRLVDCNGKDILTCEALKELYWWKYVGVVLQGDLKQERMVDQITRAAQAKAGALGTYMSYAGGLTPAVQMMAATGIVPGTMMYAAPAWCGVGEGQGATGDDMKQLGKVWDSVLRSTFGCARFTHGACMRAEAGWTSFDMECAKHVVMYFKRVQLMKDDIIDDEAETEVRPVKALLMELVLSHARRPGYNPDDSPIGAKFCKALKTILGDSSGGALAGSLKTACAWDKAIKEGCKTAAMEEMQSSVGDSNTAALYAASMGELGVPYYLKRARYLPQYARSNTLYRLIHLRVGAHSLARRTHHFQGGPINPLCPCGCGEEEDSAYFVYGCPARAAQRAEYYDTMMSLFGRHFTEDFLKKRVGVKWATTMRWLNGLSPWVGEDFDKWFAAFMDMLAGILKAHPTWG
jgi:hypothetical protein